MRKVPVFFDPAIDLAEIMRAASLIGCTVSGNGRGELVVIPTETTGQLDLFGQAEPDNVLTFPMRRES